ncbi:MAG: hypothetical protein HY730_05310 [Candidatus Tectomicrobia bacterium]|uniref:Uncharacterized protein n=1 Tax=Tectimicrobiota bacterium TaxID=2528274 RepID=A0A933GLH4_UNCTE|nr:hypothetical protein [Candidatus Tectomicrobia bacterium]
MANRVENLINDLARPANKIARFIGTEANGDLTESTIVQEVEGQLLKGEFLRSARIINTR